MANLLDYVRRAGGAGFLEEPVNEVDMACLTQLVYLPFGEALKGEEELTLEAAGGRLAHVEADKVYNVFFRKRLELMRVMMGLPRYAGMLLRDYVKEIDPESEKQFCALTFKLPDGALVISFEGTDTTLVGWKEDFNMSFESPVPAQTAACAYLERAAARDETAPLMLTGHSKGGNLAVWAAAFSGEAARGRVEGVYSFDGPGLMDRDVETQEYAQVSERIRAYLPQDSLVGMLMRRHEPAIVVKSGAFSVLQHDLFSWEVEEEAPAFVRLPQLSRRAQMRDSVLDEWLGGISLKERECFCDAVYRVLSADESHETLLDLVRPDPGSALRALRALMDIDPVTRKMIRRALGSLFSGGAQSLMDAAREAVLDALPDGWIKKDEDEGENPDETEAAPAPDGEARQENGAGETPASLP